MRSSSLPASIVKSTQWFEFATNASAVTFVDDAVLVQDWLIQLVAADSVADVIVEVALNAAPGTIRTVAGPEVYQVAGADYPRA